MLCGDGSGNSDGYGDQRRSLSMFAHPYRLDGGPEAKLVNQLRVPGLGEPREMARTKAHQVPNADVIGKLMHEVLLPLYVAKRSGMRRVQEEVKKEEEEEEEEGTEGWVYDVHR
ncbi:hypothetical protein HZH68_003340 [Vespula germanica]|uniref:Uncharacterized protein n=1 Tax=Vespula germanica TaxID=30212 RepID=A0A834U326_VESGE|nr:hypothetical protein HZH68_003340 [Vespula germanica]